MNIIGLGTIFAGGRGINKFQSVLKKSEKNIPYLVPEESLKDKSITRKMRRSDRFSKMAAIAAFDAVEQSKIKTSSLGIIVSTGLGPHTTTFKFLDGILDYGQGAASPTVFSNSVHNAAASYISSLLQSKGPTLTVTDFSLPFQNSLTIAKCWLNQKKCDYVLVGAIDEYGQVMNYAYQQLFSIGKINPLDFSSKSQVSPGEGSLFMVLTNKQTDNSYCKITDILFQSERNKDVDLCLVDSDGMINDETLYKKALDKDTPVSGYTNLTGSMVNTSAFNCAAGALMLRNQIQYAYKDTNPHELKVPQKTEKKELKKIECIKCSCDKRITTINLERRIS